MLATETIAGWTLHIFLNLPHFILMNLIKNVLIAAIGSSGTIVLSVVYPAVNTSPSRWLVFITIL